MYRRSFQRLSSLSAAMIGKLSPTAQVDVPRGVLTARQRPLSGGRVPARAGAARLSAARDDLLQRLGAEVRRLAVDREAVEDLPVPVDLLALVQVQRARELLDVDDVGQVGLREPEDAEGAALGGVTAEPERHDLHRHVAL